MAKIDTSTIEGYDNMSAEEKVAALLNIEFDDKTDEYNKLKKSFDRASSEIADYKKKYNEKLSAEEQQRLAFEEREKEYKDLLKKVSVQNDTASLKKLGFSDDLADKVANILNETDLSPESKNALWVHLGLYKGMVEAETKKVLVNNTPAPNGSGGNSGGLTKEQILSITDPTARQKAIADNIELFTQK